jgi:hypothetical protein
MFPVFAVLFPVCSQLKHGKQSVFPVFYDLGRSQEMKVEKTSRSVWPYQEHEEQWESA